MPNAIKGLAIASLIDDVREIVRSGRVSQTRIEKLLQAEDLAVLDEELDPFAWYPIATYERLTTALLEWTENEGVLFLQERGAAAARRLLERGLYQQLDALKGGGFDSFERYLSRVRLIATLHGSLLSFSKWKVEPDPDFDRRLRVVVTEAAAYPEVLRHVADGFINACVAAAGGDQVWTSERVAPDRIVIRMDSDL